MEHNIKQMYEIVLIDDEIWSETQHSSITLLVRSPAQTEGHEEEPRALQQRHLIIQVQISEALTQHTHINTTACVKYTLLSMTTV